MFLVARPGTSYPPPPEAVQHKDHNVPSDSTGQQPILGGTSGDVSGIGGPSVMNPSTGPGLSAGPGFGDQTNDDDDFDDFQEAKPSFPSQTPNSAGWSTNHPQPVNQVSAGQPTFHGNQGIPGNQHAGSIFPNQHIPGDQQQSHQFHANQPTPGSQLSGNDMFNSNQQVPGNQGGNLQFPGNHMQGNQHFPNQPGHNIPTSTWPNQSGTGTMAHGAFTQSSVGPNQFSNRFPTFNAGTIGQTTVPNQRERADSQSSVSSVSSVGMTSERPVRVSGQFAPMDGQQPGNMQQFGQQSSPGQMVTVGENDQATEGTLLSYIWESKLKYKGVHFVFGVCFSEKNLELSSMKVQMDLNIILSCFDFLGSLFLSYVFALLFYSILLVFHKSN